nr:RHS repeat-associated core domain-containing protein [Ramlibacter albus]
MYRNGKLYAIHSDHLGTPRLITDSSKAVVWQWPYSALGANKPTGVLATWAEGALKATEPPIEYNGRFPGQTHDPETGLNDNGWRTFDPRTRAGYIQADPIGLAGGLNRYPYAENSPLRKTDPTGRLAFALPLILPPLLEGAAYIVTAAAVASTAHELTKPDAAGNSTPEACPPGGTCPPCRTTSGRIIPVGTIAYRPLDVIPDDVMQHGVYGSHHNIFIANQMPYPKCDCFWAKQKWVAKPEQIQPSWVPIEPFAN